VLDSRTDDTIEDLIRFHKILGIDIMLRISVDVFEPIACDCDTDEWINAWEFSGDRKKLTHTIATPAGSLTETFNLEGEEFHSDPSKDWMKLRNVRTEPLVKGAEDLQLIKKYDSATEELCCRVFRAVFSTPHSACESSKTSLWTRC
jgi:hypothetical protein